VETGCLESTVLFVGCTFGKQMLRRRTTLFKREQHFFKRH